MHAQYTEHAATRSQQRGIPRLVIDWLAGYGEEIYDGRGGVVRFFSRRSIRRMERDFGRVPLRRMSEYLRCYLVEATDGGSIITVGKRHRNAHVIRP